MTTSQPPKGNARAVVRDENPMPLADGAVRVFALGGIGEIGRNMTVYEYAGRLLIVDCGVLFPEDDQPGIDLILPDFSHIEERIDDIDALVITHGHLDHIGAVPWLLRLRPSIPVIGSRFSLALIAANCKEHRLNPDLQIVAEKEERTVGPFILEFFAVNHSIPDALAIGIHTPVGTILHSGDLKLDQLPLDGRLTDLGGLARLGESGIDLALIDATNADVLGPVPSEVEIGPVLVELMLNAPSRVIVSCFSSHVHRVQQSINAAVATGRKVAFVGRSIVKNMAIAEDLGLLAAPTGTILAADKLMKLPSDRVVLICTGSQGEPLSALARIANGSHREVSISNEDTVIFASTVVPGNENSVFKVINALEEVGARVFHQGIAKVHVSGHASAPELLVLLNLLQAKTVIPVHGEWRHLRALGRLAERVGTPAERVIQAPNGVVVDFNRRGARVAGKLDVGMVYVDGNMVGDVGIETLSDRLVLGEGGFIAVNIVINGSTGKRMTHPTLTGKGFSDNPAALNSVIPLIEKELQQLERDMVSDTHQIAQAVRRVVGRWVAKTYRRRPMIVPTVTAIRQPPEQSKTSNLVEI